LVGSAVPCSASPLQITVRHAQGNSTSFPHWEGKWVLAFIVWTMGEVLMLLIVSVVCLHAAQRMTKMTISADNRHLC